MVLTQTNSYNSSTVKSSSYNYKEQTLTVHFDNATYVYQGVQHADYNDFATADSQGRALNQFIKGKYEFEKINETKQEETV
jgi:hypothetical protein